MQPTIPKVLIRKYLVIPLAVVLVYALAGFAAVPELLRWAVPKYARHTLHCRAEVDAIRINPFLLTLEVHGFRLGQEDGSPLISFARLRLDLETSSLLHWAIVLRQTELDQPDMHLIVEADGSTNFEKLAAAPSPAPAAAPSVASRLPFILRNAAIREGRIALVDRRQSTPAEFTLQGLSLQLQEVSTVRDHNGTYHLAAATAEGESVQWSGELSLSPLRSRGTFAFNAVRADGLWQFFRDSTNLEQPAGRIDISAEYSLNAEKTPFQMTLDGLRVSSGDLSLKRPNTETPFFQLKKLGMEAARFDLATRELHLGRLLMEDGALAVRIDETGETSLQQLVRAHLPDAHRGKSLPAPAVPPSSPAAALPFKVRTDAIDIKNMALDLDDRSRKIPAKVSIAGADLHLQASLDMGAGKDTLVLRDISSALRKIRVHGSSGPAPLLTIDTLTAEGGAFDLGARSLGFARIALNKGHFDATREIDGALNWQQLVQPKKSAPSPSASHAWKVLVKSYEVDGFNATLIDLSTHSDKPVLNLREISARLTEVDGQSPMGFKAGFKMEQGGSANASGTINPAIPSVAADVALSGVVLTSLQPYIEQFATLQLQSASASAQGNLRYGIPGDPQKAIYKGSFSLNSLRLADTGTQTPYLSLDAVLLPQCTLAIGPNRLDAREVRIFKPAGELIIGEDKTLNIVKVMKNRPNGQKSPPSAEPAAVKSREKAFAYSLSKVLVENGDLVFADLSLRPRFRTRIHNLKGSVSGLSSVEDSQASIQMDGHVDQYGMAKISGVIRPNSFGRASEVNMVFRNLNMKNLSPYTGKFAGRLIQSGSFSADLKYTLKDYKMTGDNKFVIDDLMLGDGVDQPEATDLPLDLALALLKDANGRIDIGLPVAGDLNDPQFNFGSLVWKMVTNLITKTATAPFRALGSLLGGKPEKFESLEFDPGSIDLLPPEKEKLQKLADALKSRPQLKLVIQGRYSPETDGRALKERSLSRTVATRIDAKLKPEDPPQPLDFDDSSTQDALELLYEERFGKTELDALEKSVADKTVTPRTPIPSQTTKRSEAGMLAKMADNLKLHKIIPGGKSRDEAALWAAELHVRLVEKEQLAGTAYLQLAEQRARTVATYLADEAQIPKERVRLTAPEPFSGPESPAVTFSLDAL